MNPIHHAPRPDVARDDAPSLDAYRSRTGAREEIVAREDPVVWGRRGGPFGRESLEAYERRGYLVVDGLLDDELEGLQREAARIRDDPGAWPAAELISEPGGGALRSAFRIHRRSPVFASLATSPKLVDAAAQILGSEVYIHQSRMNYKPALDGRDFFWHSDFETWHVEDGMPRMRAVSASVLLADNTVANGPLLIVPGSHRQYVRCEGRTPAEHYKRSLERQQYGVPSREALHALTRHSPVAAVVARAGSVLFFDCNAMHASPGNLSPYPRHNAFFVFNSVDNRLVDPFGGRPARPGFLAERHPGDRRHC
jgi:ectoine hydroxylase